MKRARKKLPKGIRQLSNGSFQISVTDSQGKRHRPSFETLDEAIAEKERLTAKKATGQFLATAANTSFGELLDSLLADRLGMISPARYGVVKSMAGTLRDAFGTHKLSEFEAERMSFVQDWFDTSALSTNYLKGFRSLIKTAFDYAIVTKIIGRPSPVDHFGIKVRARPQDDGDEGVEDKVLTFEEMEAVLRAAQTRDDGEPELAFYMRFVLVIVGLLTALRPGEMAGLFWDCVDLDGRMIYVRRSWRRGVGIVRLTKTGRGASATSL
jgi:integrase